jgi:hypothetical protein
LNAAHEKLDESAELIKKQSKNITVCLKKIQKLKAKILLSKKQQWDTNRSTEGRTECTTTTLLPFTTKY